MRWQNIFDKSYFAGLLFFVRMARNEAKETIFQPCIFPRKALLSLSFMRCNPTLTEFELQLFLRRIGGAFLSKSLSNFHFREKNGSNQPNGNSNPGFLPQLSFKNCLPFRIVKNCMWFFLKKFIGKGSKPFDSKLHFEP